MPGITVSFGAFEHRDRVLVEQISERLAPGQLAGLGRRRPARRASATGRARETLEMDGPQASASGRPKPLPLLHP
jgi:hypothetical protein